MMQKLPRVLLCAPTSGAGKTTITCGILMALLQRGCQPVSFKCGPDYIDPMFHASVLGTTSRNLDLFLTGQNDVQALLWQSGKLGDVCVLEGAMGYYDGMGMTTKASAWDMACRTATPAILVVDATGSALSIGASITGFLQFRRPSQISAVILNRITPSRYETVKACLEEELNVPILGFLPDLPECAMQSRHLGLVTAEEIEDLQQKMRILGQEVAQHIDLDHLLQIAQNAQAIEIPEVSLPGPVSGRPRIAVARDRAFCFYYEDNLALLQQLGAELVFFSPLWDRSLPEEIEGLYLGGGYPELYADILTKNNQMRKSICGAVQGGLPTIAECGGFLYLHKTLEGDDGAIHPMAGVVEQHGFKTDALSRFGYITMTAQEDGLLGPAGTQIPAHEFHYWDSQEPGQAFSAQKPQSQKQWMTGYHSASCYMGFAHMHFWGAKDSAKRFVQAALDHQHSAYGAQVCT